MRIGKVISVENGPKRDVKVRISSQEIYSEISEPPGAIPGSSVCSYDVVEEKIEGHLLVHLYLKTIDGGLVRFYTGEAPFDVALILDELEASLGDKPRTWKKAEPSSACDSQPCGFRTHERCRWLHEMKRIITTQGVIAVERRQSPRAWIFTATASS